MISKHPKPRVAILEDDADVCKLVRFILQKEFEVTVATNGAHLRQMVDQGALDVIVLDIGLPEEDGISIAQKIRTTSAIPLVFLSGYLSEEMIIKGLNIGADDYVTKPFQPEVLLARVRSALRRGAAQPRSQHPQLIIQFEDIKFDVRAQLLTNSKGRTVHLTEMEAMVLSTLAQAENQTLSREELFRRVYGRDWDLFNRGLEVHLSHLRRKLTAISGVKNSIVGLRGVGYYLALDQVNPLPAD